MHIIELSDHNIRFSNQDEVLIESPGFANIALATPVFGEEARQQARLHPRQSFNQFWSQLSLDPLVNANSHFRHQADLAYGHLNSLAKSCELNGEVIFVIPGNYNRNQLAVLLGLAGQCSFTAVGLVDKAVLATSSSADTEQLIYLDIQLHQAVLTKLSNRHGRLQRESVLQIPGAGLLTLQDAWASMITDAFIKQSRFDPLHNAETEQYIYNQLPHWLNQSISDNEVFLEINNKGTIHQASINRGHFEQRAKKTFSTIKEEIETLSSAQTKVFIPNEIFSLPGFSTYIPNSVSLRPSVISENCFDFIEHIRGDEGALNFITSLPAVDTPVVSSSGEGDSAGDEHPSHILVNNKAYELPANMLYLGQTDDPIPNGKGVAFIEINDPALDGLFTISRQSGGFVLEKNDNDSLRINGELPTAGEVLQLGDRINVVNSGINIQLIQVQ